MGWFRLVQAIGAIRAIAADDPAAQGGLLHNPFLGGFVGVQLASNPAFAHDHHPVAHAQDFGQLGRNHDNRLALLRQVVEQVVNLAFRAHIDAAGRLVEDQDVGIGGQPLADDHLLLVAAG